ncbi:MAG: response regulator transcription factor [Parvibaculales bacterium]
MPQIALVDDDANILASLAMKLKSEGFVVKSFHDGHSALEALAEKPADIGIFDIKMPRMTGMELLKKLRLTSDMPVIFLTSKDQEIDEVFGLKMGADDYITKPFSQRLLLARIDAVLRRNAHRKNPKPPKSQSEQEDIIQVGKLRLNVQRHECLWGEVSIQLTITEFLILSSLARRPGLVKSRNDLLNAAYEDRLYIEDRTIDSHIKRLRKKMKAKAPDFDAIETLYGIGYRYQTGE